jgi:hypothetical protein
MVVDDEDRHWHASEASHSKEESTSGWPLLGSPGRQSVDPPVRPRLSPSRTYQRLPVPWVRPPLTPPNQRHKPKRKTRRPLQPAERDVLDEREDVALEGGEVHELAVRIVPNPGAVVWRGMAVRRDRGGEQTAGRS